MKISIVGTGHVGAAVGFALVTRELADEVVMVNRTRKRAEGEAVDLAHAASFVGRRVRVRAGDIDDTRDSEIVVFTASIAYGPDFRTRNEMARGNAELLRQWIGPLCEASPGAVLVMVTNPVDPMAYLAWKLSGFPAGRVIGSGTLLDSGRYRAMLSEHLGIHPDDIRAYILGEHGETQFPALSVAVTGGRPFDREPALHELFEKTRRSGHEVYQLKGHTSYAIALSIGLIVEAVSTDSRRTMPVSTLIDGYQGVGDVFLSVPVIVGRGGVLRQLSPPLDEREADQFRASAATVRAVIDEIVS